MRLFYLTAAAICCTVSSFVFAQDFSNKGKDFWVGYGLHCRMFSGAASQGGTQEMVLYFATEAVTTVTVSIPGLGYSVTYPNIPANTIFTSNPLPKTGATDARLTQEGVYNKGIHITSDRAIVAYAHIYNGNVSGATLLFPTNTLGKEYYSINYEQRSNEGNSNAFFYAVAVDTGITTIEVIPSASTQGMAAGNTYTFNLTQGQVLNALGTISGNNGVDLTGSRIRSISSGTQGCKRIAVFSGSGKIYINCGFGGNSADNYMVQAFPKTAWGKNYLTVPTSSFPNNFFRICVDDPTTVVRLNGSILNPVTLINNFYYQVGPTSMPNHISSDKPIMVAQYITTQGTCGNGPVGDPEVIYLSPVEQNINRVILNSTPNFAIQSNLHFLNVLIPNGGTALSSFRIDGAAPTASFITHPQNTSYSYLVQNVSQGQHIIQSDSGFNAIAYGYGSAESYGYNAGANVKDLFQFISIQNQFATVNFPAGCRGAPFYFSIVFPYEPTQIQWIFNGLFPNVTLNNPVFDSTWVVSGRQVYRYKLPSPYTIPAAGTYPIRVIAQNPTPDGCGGVQEIDYDLEIFDPPVAGFYFNSNGCVTSPVNFFDTTNTGGRPIISWSWSFGDGGTASNQHPTYAYSAPDSYTAKLSVITDVGCLSDTAYRTVILTELPVAKFGVSLPGCTGVAITFTDSSTVSGGGSLVKWYWNFGDGSPAVVVNSNAPQVHTYTTAGTFTVTLKVETSTGCQSVVYSQNINIHPNPVAGFTVGDICLPAGTANFSNTSTIASGTITDYLWNFGDGNTSNQQNPTHNYVSGGPFTVTLSVTSNNGCTDDTVRTITNIYAQPQANFTAPPEVCFGNTVSFSDLSTAPNSTIAQWAWDFGDGTTSGLQNPVKNYSSAGSYSVTLTVTSAAGCPSTTATGTVVVNPLPVAGFNTSSPACAGRSITFTDQSLANAGTIVKWTWNYGDGTNAVLTNGNPFTHTYPAPGTYNVSLQVETSKGCVSTVNTRPITVHVIPVAGFITPEVCLLDPMAPFIDTSRISTGSVVAWQWNFGDPDATAGNPNTSGLQHPSHQYSVIGSYTASLIAVSDQGCADTIEQTFTVNGSIPVSSFTVQNSNSLCSNKDVTIVNTSTVDFGNIVNLEIYWDDANDPTVKTVDPDPLPGKTYIHTYPEFGSPATQTYTIRMVVYSGINCLDVITKNITILSTPSVRFDPVPGVCSVDPPFQVTQAGITNTLPGSGVFSGPGVSVSGLFNPSTAGVGVHTIRYTYTGTNSCSNYAEQTIEVFPTPVANAGPDKFVLEGGVVQLTPALNAGFPVAYSWMPPAGLSNPNIADPMASPSDDITYTLTVTSGEGCSTSDLVFVKVLKKPEIPNIFSPNGDGIHDKWVISYLDTYPGCTVEIFNRYGQRIFYSSGYSQPWDGTVNGNQVPVGTYYYIVDPKNGRKPMSGYVDVIR